MKAMDERGLSRKIKEAREMDDLTMFEVAAMVVGGVLLQVRGDGNAHRGDLHEAL